MKTTQKTTPTRPYTIVINEMMSEGYTFTELKRWSNLNYQTIKNISRGKTKYIKATTADIISKMYQEYLVRQEEDKYEMDILSETSKWLRGLKNTLILGGIVLAIVSMLLVFMFFAVGNN